MATSYTSNTSSVVEAILLADLDKVDMEVLQETFQIVADQNNTNMIVLEKPIVEGILEISRNGEIIPGQQYKHVPGKPWVIFSDPLQTDESVEVDYFYSPYPDMVVTNWDSNKGDYIFYNTESSVGVTEQGGFEAWGHGGMEVWPVPAREAVKISRQLTVDSRQSSVNSHLPQGISGSMKIEICSASGMLIKSVMWPEGKAEMEVNVGDLKPGFYLVNLKSEDRIIANGKFIVG
jgi:hypothetical protein